MSIFVSLSLPRRLEAIDREQLSDISQWSCLNDTSIISINMVRTRNKMKDEIATEYCSFLMARGTVKCNVMKTGLCDVSITSKLMIA